MGLLTANYWLRVSSSSYLSSKTHLRNTLLLSGDPFGLNDAADFCSSQYGFGARISAFASRKSAKNLKRNKDKQSDVILQTSKNTFDDYSAIRETPPSGDDSITGGDFTSVNNKSEENSMIIPSRSNVLQACSVTSGLMAVLGLAIRQVLTSLTTLDYIIVAFLPGISEELLFRGGLLPLVGLNWKGALAVAALFGILHLGNGRKYSFAIWATFVGFTYGYATIVSSSLVVPMASHALNNLVGAFLWRLTSKSSEETTS